MSTRLRILWIGGLVSVFAHLAASPTAAQTPGSVSGIVRHADTNAPIANATVRIAGSQLGASTNREGRFRIEGVPAGEQVVEAQLIGFTFATVPITVAADSTIELVIRLSPTALSLDGVVVTATMAERDVLDVPVSASVVSAWEIETRGAHQVADALVGTPSIRITDYSDGFSQGIQIRSLGESGHYQNAEVLVLVDGIPQLNANSQSFLDQVPFEEVERIEIVRGPSSALYGRNAIAGTVNIITRMPPNEPTFAAELGTGSFGYLRPRLHAGGSLGDGRFSFLASGSMERSNGWRDRTRRESEQAYAKGLLDMGGGSTLSLTAQYLGLRHRLASQIPLRADGTELPVRRITNLNVVPGHRTLNEMLQIGASWVRPLSASTELTVVGYLRDTDRLIRADGSFIDAIDEENHLLVIYPFDSDLEERIVGAEPRVTWKSALLGRGHQLTAGASVEHSKGTSPGAFLEGPGSGPYGELFVNYLTGEADVAGLESIPSRDGRFDVDNYGAYVQSELELTERTSLTTGLRWDRQERSLVDDLRGSNRSASYSRLTPRVALNHRFDAVSSIYLTYGEGFNPPFGAAFQFDRPGVEDLKPERAQNYEVGLKLGLLDRRLHLAGALFRTERRDLVQTVRQDNQNVQVNAGALDINGVEVEVTAYLDELLAGASLRGTYAYADPVWKNFVLSGVDYAGTIPVNVSRHVASLSANWQNEWLGAVAWGDYMSGWYMDRSNSVRSDDYTVFNAGLTASHPAVPGVSLGLHLRNLLNTEYFTRSEVDIGGNVIAASPGRPRWFELNVGYRW